QAVSGSIRDVEHVVMLMMENRSFDQILGSLSGVRGFDDPNAFVFPNGNSVFYQPQGTNYVLPFHPTNQCIDDVAHDWYLGHVAWDQGQWDRWIPARSPRAMTYCTRDDLSFLYALADAYTVCDRSEEHTSELQSPYEIVCRLLLEKKKAIAAEFSHRSHSD